MKKIMYLGLVCFILIALSCKSNNDSNKNNNANNPIIVDSLIFGYWINIDYLDNISKTKSPYNAINLNPYRILEITKDYLKGDILKITWEDQTLSEFPGFECYKVISPTLFEYIGYASLDDTIPKLKEHYSSKIPPLHRIKLENSRLLVIDNNNNVLKKYCILTRKKNMKNVTSETFEILNEKINKELIEGKYQDIANSNKIISFLENGKVKGIDNFKNYEVNIFFSEDYGRFKNDFIEFSNSKEDNLSDSLNNKLIFEFEGDKLLLYEFYNELYNDTNNEQYMLPKKGKLKYKLKKL